MADPKPISSEKYKPIEEKFENMADKKESKRLIKYANETYAFE